MDINRSKGEGQSIRVEEIKKILFLAMLFDSSSVVFKKEDEDDLINRKYQVSRRIKSRLI